MQVEYTLDQWEWQGVTRSIDIDPEDYRDMSADEIKEELYQKIFRDAEQNLHLVFNGDDAVREIAEKNTLAGKVGE